MKMYDPHRADTRPIGEKTLGLLYAMNADQAAALHKKLMEMAQHGGAGGDRARMFCGVRAVKP